MNKKRVLIFQNSHLSPAGSIVEKLEERSIDYTLIDLDRGDTYPDLAEYDALIVLGGPDSASDDTSKIQGEIAMIKKALAADIPYLGVCLGMQLLVKASGGSVKRNPVKEIGFRDPEGLILNEVTLTSESQNDPILQGIDSHFHVFQAHEDTVVLVDSIKLLATGKYCDNQMVRVRDSKAYGTQFHFELTPEVLNLKLTQNPFFAEVDSTQVRADYEAQKEEYDKIANTLFANFLTIAELV